MTNEPYSIYDWEPAVLQYYPDSILAETTWGQFYECLQIEKTNEGWHALILEWEDLSDDDDTGDLDLPWQDEEPCYVMVDEKVFDAKSKEHAKEWLMRRDSDRFAKDGDE